MKLGIGPWFAERWPIRQVLRWSLEEKIPGGDSFWYSLGAATLFLFVIQVVTGIWQMFWYVPTTDHAYQSVMYLRQHVPFGWLIHGLHGWGSNVFIVLVFLHMLRVFVWGAYKYPRQLIWLIGALLFFTVIALSFTGALLPWDELGYWAAEVGTSIAGTIPVVGFFFKELMRGGAAMSQETLSRFFIAHIAILPGLLAALIVAHLVAFRQYGSVGPWEEQKQKKSGWFWPNQIVKDLIVIGVLFLLLVGLSAFWRAPVTGPADPIDNIITPKPEWQFLFLYQFLKLFKGPWEPVGTTGVPLVLFLIIFLLPLYDRRKKRNPFRRPLAMLGALALMGWLFAYTYLGYISKPGAAATASVTVSSTAAPGVKAGAGLFTSQGCVACHTVHGQGGNIGPDLSHIGAQGLSRAWLTQQIRDPKSHDPSTQMPAFDSLSAQQVSHLVDFLESLGGSGKTTSSTSGPRGSSGPNDPSPKGPQGPGSQAPSALVAQGRQLFHAQPCLNCHTVDGQGGKVGPSLSHEGTKDHSPRWLIQQIRDPKSHNPTSFMPSFSNLSDQQVKELAAYLESLGTSSSQSSSSSKEAQQTTEKSPSSSPSSEPNAPPKTGEPNAPPESGQRSSAALIEQGKKLFHSGPCSGCHTIDGQGGKVGPNLSKEGAKGHSPQWLTQQIRDPKSHDPQTAMPSFKEFSDQQVQGLVAYLESLGESSSQTASSTTPTPGTASPAPSQAAEPNVPSQSSEPNLPGAGQQGPPGRAAYLVGQTVHGIGTLEAPMHGKLLYDKWCRECHGKDGQDDVNNPGSVSGKVPPLNPIAKALYSDNPLTFAENVDRYLQHGSMPKGPHPEKYMPAFGDNMKLTQEMISEIEAYVLRMNGVDRAKIMTPGIRPRTFFLICLIAFTLALSVRGLYRSGSDKDDSGDSGAPDDTRPAPSGSAPPAGGSPRERHGADDRGLSPGGPDRNGPSENMRAAEEPSGEGKGVAPAPSLSFAIVVVITVAIIGAAVSLIFGTFVTARPIPAPASAEAMKQYQVTQSTNKVTFNPPALSDAPQDMQEAVNRGHRIHMDTRKELPQYVGNKLDCRNCHFEAGKIRKTLSLVGVAAKYPRYGSREDYSVDLVERTNQCLERNCNGKPLPPDGKDMQAIMAYYHWISKGIPVYAEVPWLGLQHLQSQHKPEASNGKTLFGNKCSSCHGQEGQGTEIAPPLWGKGSFSDGAGMSHLETFAAFDHAFMPKGNPDLQVDEALDIAAYVTAQSRPHYATEE